ncbi:MAG: hypothetical protein AAFN70_05925 [Planctomycetota bacterium]
MADTHDPKSRPGQRPSPSGPAATSAAGCFPTTPIDNGQVFSSDLTPANAGGGRAPMGGGFLNRRIDGDTLGGAFGANPESSVPRVRPLGKSSLGGSPGGAFSPTMAGGGLKPEAVIDGDQREPVDPRSGYYQPVCRIAAGFPGDGGTYIGTGLLVQDRFVITVAHNLQQNHVRCNRLQIDFGYHQGSTLATVGAEDYGICPDYPTQSGIDYSHPSFAVVDYACIKLDRSVASVAKPMRVLPYENDMLVGELLELPGYPIQLENPPRTPNGESMYSQQSTFRGVLHHAISHGVDATDGNSGSPLMVADTTNNNHYTASCVGLHSRWGTFGSGGFFNLAVPFTPEVIRDFRTWMGLD